MGLSIYSFIEYDNRTFDGNAEPPFSRVVDQVIDLTDYTPLSAGKDYPFFSAISGFRATDNKQPLYKLRGLPTNVSKQVCDKLNLYFDLEDSTCIGWLTLNEIEEALSFFSIDKSSLSLAVNLVLNTMAYLQNQLGKDRVRFIFAIQ